MNDVSSIGRTSWGGGARRVLGFKYAYTMDVEGFLLSFMYIEKGLGLLLLLFYERIINECKCYENLFIFNNGYCM